MPCVAAAIVSESGMPQTSHARANAVPAAAIAGAPRRDAQDRQQQREQERRKRRDQRREEHAAADRAINLMEDVRPFASSANCRMAPRNGQRG